MGAAAPSGAADPLAGTISATAGVQYDSSKNGAAASSAGVGPLTPIGGWRPPACWYQPMYTPAQLKASSEAVWAEDSPSQEWKNGERDRFVNGKPYTNFNLAKAGHGYFWAGYTPRSQESAPGASSCTDEPFWVSEDGSVPAGHRDALTPETLAELAYERILIPRATASTDPDGVQTVNLPTWVWLDTGAVHPVAVTAYLPAYGISATTTAEPVSLHLDPGTADARLHPASGNCPFRGNRLGTPYTPGAEGDPPCGVTYLRSTAPSRQAYRLTATVTWDVSWTGTGQPAPKALPPGAFGTPQEIGVREIQTVSR
ncbi:hypothetical protein ACFO3J_21860 [Streptomyces polygonati]|uniref:Secreted protein n=1 Tax=Streptomyces polygonati TaxID=1617087 RepID=A0ABV8HQ03_9ACTN